MNAAVEVLGGQEREMSGLVEEDGRVWVEQQLAQIACQGGSIRRGKIH